MPAWAWLPGRAPRGGAWIETSARHGPLNTADVAPLVGARGLKPVLGWERSGLRCRAPRGGAWIETPSGSGYRRRPRVAPPGWARGLKCLTAITRLEERR